MALTNVSPLNQADSLAGGATPPADNNSTPVRKGKSETRSTAEVAGSGPKPAVGKTKPKAKPARRASETKASIVIKKLNSPKGVTIEVLMEATGWQAHSVRGFLSAVVKKKLGLALVNDIGKDGVRRYRIDDATKSK